MDPSHVLTARIVSEAKRSPQKREPSTSAGMYRGKEIRLELDQLRSTLPI
jgi:hypothetical protein